MPAMTFMRRLTLVLFIALLFISLPRAAAAWAQPPEGQEEFVPTVQIPPQEQLAAGPLLVGAYVFVPIVLFLYLLSVARRMSAVQREIERLESDLKRSSRA